MTLEDGTVVFFRPAARVLLLDPADRILLMRFVDGDRAWWSPVGGGLDAGETYEQAARREVVEEAGPCELELGPCVWLREHLFELRGRWYRQIERYFVGRVAAFEPADGVYPGLEAELFGGLRWWTLAELEATSEVLAPGRLPELLRALLVDGPPPEPIEAGT